MTVSPPDGAEGRIVVQFNENEVRIQPVFEGEQILMRLNIKGRCSIIENLSAFEIADIQNMNQLADIVDQSNVVVMLGPVDATPDCHVHRSFLPPTGGPSSYKSGSSSESAQRPNDKGSKARHPTSRPQLPAIGRGPLWRRARSPGRFKG